jgi:hypothetical protein
MNHLIAKTALSLSVIFHCILAMAQPPGNMQDKREHIESLKISFITQKLNLTREEAQRFWPIYNEYYDALQSLRTERKEELKG